MGLRDSIVKALGGAPKASAAVYPLYETTTPQYPTPNPYWMATQTYSRNELVFACISKRMAAVSEAPLRLYDDDDSESRDELADHPVRKMLQRPNPMMSEAEFWQMTEAFTCINGFAAWEIERTNGGEPIGLWPMRPHWCSFLRGNGQPIRAVRYQPDGLPLVDVPIQDVLLFLEFNPRAPQQVGLSRATVALRSVTADNAASDFLVAFFQRGMKMSGLLKTEQSLNDAEATRVRARWREQHGGIDNWTDVAVLGQGVEFQSMQMNFRDMDFASVDMRDEARICAVFDVPPILINANVGLKASTYSNYEQARKAFYEQTIAARWRWYADVVEAKLINTDPEQEREVFPAFDIRNVKALQEDRTASFTRATTAWTQGVLTRDEARHEMGYDAVDNAPVFAPNAPKVGEVEPEPEEQAPMMGGTGDEPDMADMRREAIAAVRDGKKPKPTGNGALDDDLATAKSAGDVRRAFEAHWPRDDSGDDVLSTIAQELHALRAAKYDPNQPRDEQGRFGEGGEGSEDSQIAAALAAHAEHDKRIADSAATPQLHDWVKVKKPHPMTRRLVERVGRINAIQKADDGKPMYGFTGNHPKTGKEFQSWFRADDPDVKWEKMRTPPAHGTHGQ